MNRVKIPGGGGFMVIYLAKTHQVVTINGRETCPGACTSTMFIDPKTGQPYGYDYLEASRLSYADRDAYVGDPRYVSVPLSGLLSPAFAPTRRCLIHDHALTSPVAPGDPFPPYPSCPGRQSSAQASASPEGSHTNNIVTADKWGNIVA
jgi:gamma-glutamyltranspeptidase / glutathione hydrolase